MKKSIPLFGLPPWLWIWVVLFAIGLPSRFHNVSAQFGQAQRTYDVISSTPAKTVLESLRHLLTFLSVMLPTAFETLPAIAILVALILAFFPGLLAKHVERDSSLKPVDFSYPSPGRDAMVAFVKSKSSGVQITQTATDLDARVYAVGLFRPVIGIGSKLLRAWRRNTQDAEAIVVHELAHASRGEHLMSGAQSPLLFVLTKWHYFLILFVIVPSLLGILSSVLNAIILHNDLQGRMDELHAQLLATMPKGFDDSSLRDNLKVPSLWGLIGKGLLNNFFVYAPGTFFALVIATLNLISTFMIPVGAVWCAEMNADTAAARSYPEFGRYIASEYVQERAEISSQIKQMSILRKIWAYFGMLGGSIAHPPSWLRSYYLSSPGLIVSSFILLFFPLCYVLRFIPLYVQNLLTMLSVYEYKWSDAYPQMPLGVSFWNYISSGLHLVFLFLGLGLIAWSLFSIILTLRDSKRLSYADCAPYVLSCLVLAGIYILPYLGR